MSFKRILKYSLLGFIGLIILMVIVGIFASKKPEQSQSVSQPQPTEQSEKISLTPEQELEVIYTQSVAKIMGDIVKAMGYFGVLFQEKPSFLFWTDEEIIYVAMYTVIVEQSYETVKGLEPPEKFKTAHSFLLSGLSKYAEAMPILIYGIDHYDTDKLNQVSELIIEGAVFVNQATEELNKLK